MDGWEDVIKERIMDGWGDEVSGGWWWSLEFLSWPRS